MKVGKSKVKEGKNENNVKGKKWGPYSHSFHFCLIFMLFSFPPLPHISVVYPQDLYLFSGFLGLTPFILPQVPVPNTTNTWERIKSNHCEE